MGWSAPERHLATKIETARPSSLWSAKVCLLVMTVIVARQGSLVCTIILLNTIYRQKLQLPRLALCARDSVMVGRDCDGGAAGLHRLLNELLSQLPVHACV